MATMNFYLHINWDDYSYYAAAISYNVSMARILSKMSRLINLLPN